MERQELTPTQKLILTEARAKINLDQIERLTQDPIDLTPSRALEGCFGIVPKGTLYRLYQCVQISAATHRWISVADGNRWQDKPSVPPGLRLVKVDLIVKEYLTP